MKPLFACLLTSLSTATLTLGATLQLDFKNTGPTQAGWQAFTKDADPNNKSEPYSGITVTTSGVEFTRNYNNGGGAVPDFPGTDLDDMHYDLILRNDGGSPLSIAIAGLAAGDYQFTTHHLVAAGATATVTSFRLDVDDADSVGFSQSVGTFSMGKSAVGPTTPVFTVSSNGVDPVTLRLTVDVLGPGGTGNWMGINGLEIGDRIPEPSSGLLGLVAASLMLRRRRK